MNDQKLLTYLEGFMTQERKKRFQEILEERTKFLTVAIEDVYQMHNASAVVRSCEIFGIQEAHLIESKYGKRLDSKIALGAEKWVDIRRYETTQDCIETLRTDGYRIIATTPHTDECLLDDFVIEGKTALFFGTERDGLTKTVLDQADGFLKIPMMGFTESLNISVSAAIILQRLTGQLKKGDFPWQLTTAEKLDKQIDWAKKTIKSIDDVLARYYGEK
ncbi:RNA methyltransferase [Aggregatimonas sangjinii]|uniref:tRNA (guanosine(18)-2'-O)-methyltransferase n=1 Tax=Aggregatimonas sangjinii TaxID=2583587 RepID=A0A5B7SUA9_9FLAO|nr:RNA methyltransferase [Aggregatimonas sangjinii]QCX00324.1 RNA methyltransferase [Aggregatimonas sangjinii]